MTTILTRPEPDTLLSHEMGRLGELIVQGDYVAVRAAEPDLGDSYRTETAISRRAEAAKDPDAINLQLRAERRLREWNDEAIGGEYAALTAHRRNTCPACQIEHAGECF